MYQRIYDCGKPFRWAQGVGVVRAPSQCAMIFLLNQVGACVFMNPDRLALGSWLIVIYRARLLWTRLWLMVSVWYCHAFDVAGSIGADATCCLFRECERAKWDKHVLNGATMVPLVIATFGKLAVFGSGERRCVSSLS